MSNLAHQYDPEEEDGFYRETEDRAARKERLRLIHGDNSEYDPEEDYSPADDDSDNVAELDESRRKKSDSSEDLLNKEEELENDSSDEDSLYSDKDRKRQGFKSRAKGLIGKRVGIALGGVGVSTVLALVGLGGFMQTFRLDHILQNIDYKTFSRYNATVDGLSKNYIKSYMRIRMMEFANASGSKLGDKDGNLFFRADKVYTGNPTLDWYRTLRTSDFEKKVFNENGIFFTSSVDANGKIRPARITMRNDVVDLNPDPDLGKRLRDITPDLESGNPTRIASALNKFGPAMDSFVEKEFFSSNKAARKEIKKVVHDNTKFYQVLKRRQLRKSIQNMVGVRSWTFFEQTRDKYREKKQAISHKILNRVFSGNSETAKLLSCIFTGSCSTANDINNPELRKDSGKLSGIDEETVEDSTGDREKNTKIEKLNNDDASKAAQEALEEIDKETLDDLGPDAKKGTLSQRLIQRIVTKFIGETAANAVPSPEKVWRYAKILTKFHNMMSDGKISKMVKRAKLVQLMAIYTTYAIARDQSHTGELTMEEYGELIKTTDNFNNTEAWQAIDDSNQTASLFSTPRVHAESITNVPKEEYCSGNHQKKQNEFAWFCDSYKPNNGGKAETLESVYRRTVGLLIAPIAAVINGINKIPLLGDAINFFSDLASQIIGAVTGPIINAIMEGTGLGDDIAGLFTMISNKLLEFLGAGPMFTGTEPGLGNFLLGGSAGTAETAIRSMGGVTSTPVTLKYSNKLAADWKKEELSSQSLFERYASLTNPNSLAASSLFAISNTRAGELTGSLLGSIFNLPKNIAGILARPVTAANGAGSPSSMAELSGVDTFDVPGLCFELDPLAPDYLQKATNAWDLGITPDWETLKDADVFWQKVYDKLGAENEEEAGRIYNCETANQAIRGGLGVLNGYTDDGQDINSSKDGSGSSSTTPESNTETPTGNGRWSVAKGANRPGSNLNPLLISFLNEVAKYTSYEPIVTTGTNHSKYTKNGNISDHYSGNGADFGSVINKFGTSNARPGQSVPRGDELAAAGMIACGVDQATARNNAMKGGLYNLQCSINGQRIRVQVIWKTMEGGNHHNHVHIGVKAV